MLLMLATPAARAQQGAAEASRAREGGARRCAGSRLQVAGRDFLVRGMNWDYIPIGQNYAFDLWSQPEPVITAALDREMSLLAGMGVNAIRIYAGIPAEVGALHPRPLRHLLHHQPPDGPLRIDARRRLATRARTTRTRACAPRSPPTSLPPWRSTRTARRAHVPARQREQLRPVVELVRDRGAAQGRTQHRASALPLLAVRRDRPSDQGDRTPTCRWPSPTATCSTST